MECKSIADEIQPTVFQHIVIFREPYAHSQEALKIIFEAFDRAIEEELELHITLSGRIAKP